MKNLLERVASGEILISDGATGTYLQAHGLEAGGCPEAMNEAQVSIDGHTRKLIQPFIVIATQNPFEFEGTFFLPESQLDRFLMRINLGYPSSDDEARILETDPARTALNQIEPVMTAEELVEFQKQVPKLRMDPSLIDYVIRIASATRNHEQLQIGIFANKFFLYVALKDYGDLLVITGTVHSKDHPFTKDTRVMLLNSSSRRFLNPLLTTRILSVLTSLPARKHSLF